MQCMWEQMKINKSVFLSFAPSQNAPLFIQVPNQTDWEHREVMSSPSPDWRMRRLPFYRHRPCPKTNLSLVSTEHPKTERARAHTHTFNPQPLTIQKQTQQHCMQLATGTRRRKTTMARPGGVWPLQPKSSTPNSRKGQRAREAARRLALAQDIFIF